MRWIANKNFTKFSFAIFSGLSYNETRNQQKAFDYIGNIDHDFPKNQ